ncbi:RsfA family transcriptional regulator [Bacillus sp. Bva_UNVM-123]|uniref:RsfA family transcriptional regulator n=1 Tax=Bacillus sp. Bva_UNVM-123 TaxID=2829798 RepID=UPI00391F4FC3
MSLTRQDAWSQDEDLLLAELVLKNIREGSTQLQAFEEVGKRLKRTAAACGFRWNSYVRKQYKSGIELAKKQRKARKQNVQKEEAVLQVPDQGAITVETPRINPEEQEKILAFEDLVDHLKTLYKKTELSSFQNEDIKIYEERIQTLEKQLYYLASENEKLLNELNKINKDYKEIVEIMEKALKVVNLKDEASKQKV